MGEAPSAPRQIGGQIASKETKEAEPFPLAGVNQFMDGKTCEPVALTVEITRVDKYPAPNGQGLDAMPPQLHHQRGGCPQRQILRLDRMDQLAKRRTIPTGFDEKTSNVHR